MKCANCGFAFEMGMFCPECGTKYEEGKNEEVIEEMSEKSSAEKKPDEQKKQQNKGTTMVSSMDIKKANRKEEANAKARKAGRWMIYAIIITIVTTFASEHLPELPYKLMEAYDYITLGVPLLLILGAFFIALGALAQGTELKGRCIFIICAGIVFAIWIAKVSGNAIEATKNGTFEQYMENIGNDAIEETTSITLSVDYVEKKGIGYNDPAILMVDDSKVCEIRPGDSHRVEMIVKPGKHVVYMKKNAMTRKSNTNKVKINVPLGGGHYSIKAEEGVILGLRISLQ